MDSGALRWLWGRWALGSATCWQDVLALGQRRCPCLQEIHTDGLRDDEERVSDAGLENSFLYYPYNFPRSWKGMWAKRCKHTSWRKETHRANQRGLMPTMARDQGAHIKAQWGSSLLPPAGRDWRAWGHPELGRLGTHSDLPGGTTSPAAWQQHSSSPVDKLLIPWGLGTHFWVWTPEELSCVYNRGCMQERPQQLCTRARAWKRPGCPSVGAWVNTRSVLAQWNVVQQTNEWAADNRETERNRKSGNKPTLTRPIDSQQSTGAIQARKKVSSALVQLNIHMKKLTPASYHRRHRNEHKVDHGTKYESKKTRE